MKPRSTIYFAVLIAIVLSCGKSPRLQNPICLNPQNPHYFLYHGKPLIMIGSTEHYGAVMNLDFDYVKYLKELESSELHVTGQVQGVGFRWSASNEARNRGIKGFVKNLSSGSVYIEAEGSREQLNAYVEWCKKGPRFGFVESVNVDTFPPVNFTDFRIEY